ncbi:MAG: right-handed parallel beta-helix repeat-containing protein, partial [Anaerolineae bacterium]
PSTIAGNTFQGNIAGHNGDGDGGGIYLAGSSARLLDNLIVDNVASWAGDWGQGGGLFVDDSEVTIRENTIRANAGGGFVGPPAATTGHGGGMVIWDTLAVVEDNEIVGNRATNSPALAVGGGIYVYTSTVRIAHNTIVTNSTDHSSYPGYAGFGGGLYLQDSLPVLDGNTITGNEANATDQGRGGGVRLVSCPAFTLTNNLVSQNSASQLGSGVGVAGGAGWLGHNTIADNTGGDGSGLYVAGNASGEGTAMLYGNIIHGHTVGIAIEPAHAGTVTAHYTLFEANATDYGAEVTSLDEIPPPALLLADYHLSLGSSAIDRVPPLAWVTLDIDGDPRPNGPGSDAGADEALLMRVYLPLILRQ